MLQGARGAIYFAVFVIAVAGVWEAVKLLGGDATDAWQPLLVRGAEVVLLRGRLGRTES